MKVGALIAFTQPSCRNMKCFFTSRLIEHNKNKYENQDIINTRVTPRHLLIQVASLSLFRLR